MRTQRSRPAHRHRPVPGLVALAAAVSVAGCTAAGPDSATPGPPRLSPAPQHEVAAAMVEGRPAPDERLNACELLGLTTEQIIDLTGAVMPEVTPTGSGDLGLLCTYGGPGSPERYEAVLAGADPTATDLTATGTADDPVGDSTDDGEAETADGEAADGDAAVDDPTTIAATTTPTTPTSPAFDPDIVPDTFAAGVVRPRGGAEAALAGQPALLGVRYTCSDIRGPGGSGAALSVPSAPEAPAVVEPDLATSYIDCVAAPVGGGVEAHTILVSGDELWHIALLKPETLRSPVAEASALAALHRVAEQIVN